MLLAQRETASRLMNEAQNMIMESGPDVLHERYEGVILRVTCEEMARKLHSLSNTLLELIPYVGAMIAGIRMRTTLTFANKKVGGRFDH